MPPLEFSNPQTKAGFTASFDKDQKVFVPGNDKHGAFDGMLSNIPPAVAESMIKQESNLLARKAADKPAAPPKNS